MQTCRKDTYIFDAESDAILVFDAEIRQFVDVNKKALRLYGYTRKEFLDLHHSDITAEPEKSEASIQKALLGRLTRIFLRYHIVRMGRKVTGLEDKTAGLPID